MKLFLFTLLPLLTLCSQCQESSDLANIQITKKLTYSLDSMNTILGYIQHPSQDFLYIVTQFLEGGNNYTGIVKTNFDLEPLKMRQFQLDPTNFDQSISPNGEYIYVAINENPGYLLEVNSTNLTLVKYFKTDAINLSMLGTPSPITNPVFKQQCNPPTGPSSVAGCTNMFFQGKNTSSNARGACRWQRLSSQASCFHYGDSGFLDFIPIDANNVFINLKRSGLDHLYFVRADYSNSAVLSWSKYVHCSPACTLEIGISSVSEDSLYIYALVPISSHSLFYILDISTGNPFVSGLVMANANANLFSIEEISGYVIICGQDSSSGKHFLTVILKPSFIVSKEYITSSFKIKKLQAITMNGYKLFSMLGPTSSVLTLARTPFEDLGTFSLLSERATSFTSITTTFHIQNLPSALPALTSETSSITEIVSPGISNSDKTIATDSQEYTAIFYSVNEYRSDTNGTNYLEYSSDQYVEIPLHLYCTHPDDPLAVATSIQNLNNQGIPAWTVFSIDEQVLYLNKTPTIKEKIDLQFKLTMQHDSQADISYISIIVHPCTLNKCEACEGYNPQKCLKCEFGYEPSNEGTECIAPESIAFNWVLLIIIINLSLTSLVSLLSMSSPVGLFSLINLFQLYILLPKLPPYFPPRVGNFILGLDFSIFAFDLFSWRDMPLLEQVYDEVSFNQNSHYLEIIGLESGSAFINHLPTSLFIIAVGALHLAVSIIYLILKKSCKFSLCELFIEKVFRCMTLNLYIRIIIEGSLLLFLAIMSEFEQFQESNFISIFLTIWMTIGIGVFLLFMIVWHRFGW
ncbi:unnamed protein product [Moneuplotes crassus]|uniref:Uncharacterized protein n=1 Tax=Euplotes crassus TaxID=5936 RepID=A0AAD1ULM6_EUPCR|nr:unnamed protein product [Moneuplotes crassus]